jgi:Fur family ferric uptake transcriptional regulator
MAPALTPALGERLHSRGLRATAQRGAILDVFDDREVGHLSADEVLERARLRLPEISRATVYNALAEFVAAGLLRPIAGGRLQVFEAARAPHEHFRCQECESLYDVHVEGVERLALQEQGFAVRAILLEGTCPACAVSA